MTYNDVRKNENKGFSLVELIVVIAIMAVLTAVLAPSLLSYVERSRAQKDDSAMGEVTNAFLLAMSDQDVYDEVLYYTCYGNVSCYIDETSAGANKANALGNESDYYVTTKAGASGNWQDQYTYDDNVRLDDEVAFKVGGNMRGVTITFYPEGKGNTRFFDLNNALINTFLGDANKGIRLTDDGATPDPAESITGLAKGDYSDIKLPDMTDGITARTAYLFNSVRATVGERIELASQTYRNSDFTVFIRMGTMGADASTTSGISVYGQWNGTNLTTAADDGIAPGDAVAGGNG